MSIFRNSKTNFLLGGLRGVIDSVEDGSAITVGITITAGGQIITGMAISEKAFFELDCNEILRPIHKLHMGEQSQYFNENGGFLNPEITEDEVDAIPDHIWQSFIYLKDAYYINGGNFTPSAQNNGLAIQVRFADISTFSLGQITIK